MHYLNRDCRVCRCRAWPTVLFAAPYAPPRLPLWPDLICGAGVYD